MKEQLLRDPSIEPTSKNIAEALGPAHNAYIKFIEELEKLDIHVNWRYYNDGKSWLGKALYKWVTARGAQKEATIFWLSIWDGFFKVAFYIPEKVRAYALGLPLSDEITNMIEDAKQMGKLKFFPLVFDLDSDRQLDEIYIIADFKKQLK